MWKSKEMNQTSRLVIAISEPQRFRIQIEGTTEESEEISNPNTRPGNQRPQKMNAPSRDEDGRSHANQVCGQPQHLGPSHQRSFAVVIVADVPLSHDNNSKLHQTRRTWSFRNWTRHHTSIRALREIAFAITEPIIHRFHVGGEQR
jgi:hypothetical protein